MLQLNHEPKIYSGILHCLIRNCEIKATPEERIRQKVLHYLVYDKNISKSKIVLEENYKYSNLKNGRSDILIKDEMNRNMTVVEIKSAALPQGLDAINQAIRYAQKARTKEAWITNGEKHVFLKKLKSKIWVKTNESKFLDSKFIETIIPKIPSPTNRREFIKYLNKFSESSISEIKDPEIFPFIAAVQKIVFAPDDFATLPYSYKGLHILEDRGFSELSINTPGGKWRGHYRVFLVATEGRVETVGIGLNKWGRHSAILCIAFLKRNRKHHALQLQYDEWVDSVKSGGFKIYHGKNIGGRSISFATVLESLIEACRDDLVIWSKEYNKNIVCLGGLEKYNKVSWKNSKKFLANIFHYALLRSMLRESNPYKKLK